MISVISWTFEGYPGLFDDFVVILMDFVISVLFVVFLKILKLFR